MKKMLLALFDCILVLCVTNVFAGYDEAYSALQKKDYATALVLLEEAAEKKDALALNALGVMNSQGLGIDRNPRLAIEYFEKAAALGNTNAMNSLAEIYWQGGSETSKDIQKARAWAMKSGNANDPRGAFIFFQLAIQNELSILDATGRVDRDRYAALAKRSIQERELDTQAYTMLSRSAEAGYLPAVALVAVTLLENVGEQNGTKANRLIQVSQKTSSDQLSAQMQNALKQLDAASVYLKSLGSTYVTPKMHKDTLLLAMPAALIAVASESAQCEVKNTKLVNLQITQPIKDKIYLPVDAVFLKNAILVSGVWQETWVFEVCGRSVSVPITFTADGRSGSYTNVQLKEIKVQK